MKEKLYKYKDIFILGFSVIITIIFYYIDYFYLGSILLITLAAYIGYSCLPQYYEEKDKLNLVPKIKQNINDNISNMSYPIILINIEGQILWGNKRLVEELKVVNIKEENILSIARNIDLQKLLKCDKDLSQRIKIKEAYYSIYASKITGDNENGLYMVYFTEVSNLIDLNYTRESVMLIEVDNLAEAMDGTDEANRPMLAAEVEKMINAYAKTLKAMIVKYEFNKYALSVQDKYINDETNSKFSILQKISTIERGNKLEVTLSIGIGRGGINPEENFHNAITAKELALGRGGDQVVIKNNDKISFFGGNTRELEKRTRVRARVISQAIKELIFESSNIFIMGHKMPDMDCLGAAIGIWSTTKQLGKNCNIILGNETNAIEYYISNLKKDSKYDGMFITSEEAEKLINDKTLLIIVDVHNKGYVQNIELVDSISRKIIIDHHRRSPDIIEGALLNYIEVYASSTSEMVTELIQYMLKKPRVTKLEAEGLLAGIFMDTKGFQFKTGVRTFDAASFLRGLGADTIEVKKMFADSIGDYLIIADTIKSAKIKDNVAIAVCPSHGYSTVVVARAADDLLDISGIDVAFVLCKINNNIVISARSVGDVNVQVVLEELGGGGHMNMAGANLQCDIDEAVTLLEKSIAKHIEKKDNKE